VAVPVVVLAVDFFFFFLVLLGTSCSQVVVVVVVVQASYIRRRVGGSDEWADSIYLIVRDWEVRMVRPQFIMLLNIIDNQLADIHDISKLIVRNAPSPPTLHPVHRRPGRCGALL
jgi:hypothetical protein